MTPPCRPCGAIWDCLPADGTSQTHTSPHSPCTTAVALRDQARTGRATRRGPLTAMSRSRHRTSGAPSEVAPATRLTHRTVTGIISPVGRCGREVVPCCWQRGRSLGKRHFFDPSPQLRALHLLNDTDSGLSPRKTAGSHVSALSSQHNQRHPCQWRAANWLSGHASAAVAQSTAATLRTLQARKLNGSAASTIVRPASATVTVLCRTVSPARRRQRAGTNPSGRHW